MTSGLGLRTCGLMARGLMICGLGLMFSSLVNNIEYDTNLISTATLHLFVDNLSYFQPVETRITRSQTMIHSCRRNES